MRTPRIIASLLLTLWLLPSPALAGPVEDQVAAMRDRHAKIEARVASARARMLDVPLGRAEVDLTMGKMALDTASLLATMREDPKRIEEWLGKAKASLDQAWVGTMRSRTVEARGLFIDAGSMPKTPEGVRELVDRLHKANFNMLIPEVFRRGYTIYPSRYTDRDPEFAPVPQDLLAILVTEAHRRGMEVHPWVWVFRVKSPGFGDPVLSKMPALAARSSRTEDPRFLSPADPRAREWVYGLIDELTDRYDLDGLLLDYIRYDEETPDDWISQTTFGFAYNARHGMFPSWPLKPYSQEWLEYQLWREEQVNQTVQTIAQKVKAKNPNFQISASTFRGEKYARLSKMQHWRHWSNNAWIDFTTSMLYTSKTSDLNTWIGWETDNWTRTNLLYPILGPLRMQDVLTETLDQVEFLDAKNQPGVLIFALAHLKPGMLEALATGPFRRPAMPPHRFVIHGVRRTLVELDNQYLGPIQGTADVDGAASVAVLRAELKKVQQSLPLHAAPYWQNSSLIARLEELKALGREMAKNRALSAHVAEEVAHRLEYAQALTRANAQRVTATRYVPPSMPPGGPPVDTKEVRD